MKTQIIKIVTLSFVLGISLFTTSCKNNDVMPDTNFAETGNHSAARSGNFAILQSIVRYGLCSDFSVIG